MTPPSTVRAALAHLLEADPATVLLGESVGRHGGIGAASAGLLARFGPERVLDTPVATTTAVGLAIGLALGGRRPIVELASAERLPAAVDALFVEALPAARAGWPVPLVLRAPVFDGAARASWSAAEPLLASAPGLQVASGASEADTAALLLAAHASGRPTVILEPLDPLPPSEAGEPGPVEVGAARRVRTGGQVTLLAWGAGLGAALEGARRAAEAGFDAEVLDLRWLAPLDAERLGAAVRATGRAVVVHPAGPGPVLQSVLDTAFLYLESPPSSVAAAAGPAEVARAIERSVTW